MISINFKIILFVIVIITCNSFKEFTKIRRYSAIYNDLSHAQIEALKSNYNRFKRLSDINLTDTDDDNIPYDNWGDEIFVGQELEVDCYENKRVTAFDPISATEHKTLWHRGYPVEFVHAKNENEYKGKIKRKVLVQADFWDGDPDIDAICRLSKKPIVKFDKFEPFCSNQLAPFNSQNTFLSREVIPYYAVLPHTGRMDDIWGSYILQYYFPDAVIYNKATVYQDRNEQDLVTNLENEVIGYRNTYKLLGDLKNYYNYLPEAAQKFWDVYRKHFTK